MENIGQSAAESSSEHEIEATRRTSKPAAIPRLKEEIFGFKPEDNVTTVIDVDAVFSGSTLQLRGNKGMMVSGRIEANIDSDGAIFVGKDAEIVGAVRCRKLIVDGKVTVPGDGLLMVTGMLGLSGRSSVSAKKIQYVVIEMARGCKIIGDIAPLED